MLMLQEAMAGENLGKLREFDLLDPERIATIV